MAWQVRSCPLRWPEDPLAENPTVVFTHPERVAVEMRAIPDPRPGEALIQTHLTLISAGTETTVLAGSHREGSVWGALASWPYVPGYSNVGTVLAVGEGVDGAWIGRRVHSHGPHQAFALAPVDKMAAVPDSVADHDAVFTTLAKVAMNALRRGGVTWGECAVVTGLGILGQLATRLCLYAGVRPVFAVEPWQRRRGYLPVDDAVVPASGCDELLGERIRARNVGRLADVVIEASGYPAAIPMAAALLAVRGRLVIASSPRGATMFDFHDLCNRQSLQIIGAHSLHHPLQETPDTPWTSQRHGECFLDLLACGRISVEGMVSHQFRGVEASRAYAQLADDPGATMAVVLDWTAG
jgi:2-desacetyl-2-hydroxyethyl bacteriochlorophyllide A dehydrogenase